MNPSALTPEAIEQILADFRGWLMEASARPAAATKVAVAFDLETVTRQFTALRQEVNLQTRAVRAQQEQNAQMLEALKQASEKEVPSEPSDERGWLKTMVETYDALSLARRELAKVQDSFAATLSHAPAAQLKVPDPPKFGAVLPWWARMFGLGKRIDAAMTPLLTWTGQLALARTTGDPREDPLLGRARDVLQSVLAGYTMSLQRLDRAFAQYGLMPIQAIGAAFDPDRMEAIDIVTGTGKASGEVVEEIRRGYLWQGSLFRTAQVRVAKE